MFQGAKKSKGLGLFLFLSFFQFTSLFSSSVFAQNACLDLFRQNDGIIVAANDNLTVIDTLSQQVLTWNKMLGEDFQVKKLALYVDPVSVAGSYFLGTKNEVHIGYYIDGFMRQAREVTLAHEFSHAVFQQNFYIVNGGEKIYFRDLAVNAQKNIAALEKDLEFRELEIQLKRVNDTIEMAKEANLPDQIAELQPYFDHLQEKVMEKSMDIQIYNHFSSMLRAYNELFADSLPALLWHDAHKLSDLLDPSTADFITQKQYEITHRANNPNAPRSRDFAPMSFKDWKHELADDYTSFDPSRGVLWTLYMENLPKEEIPLFLKTMLAAIGEHVRVRVERQEDVRPSNKEANLTALNQEFLRIFRVTAEQQGLKIRKTSSAGK